MAGVHEGEQVGECMRAYVRDVSFDPFVRGKQRFEVATMAGEDEFVSHKFDRLLRISDRNCDVWLTVDSTARRPVVANGIMHHLEKKFVKSIIHLEKN